jgi:hypothetical protein
MSTIGNWRGPNIVKDGLVLYLDPGSPNSYFNKTNTTIKDISGNGNNGTLVNGPTYITSSGGGLSFDGTDDYVRINSTNTSTQVTLNFWVKVTNTPPDYIGLINRFNGVGGTSRNRFLIQNNLQKLYFEPLISGVTYDVISDSFPSILNNNTMCTMTWDGNKVLFYINGVSVMSTPYTLTGTLTSGTTNPTIGWGSDTIYYFGGNIYNVLIYNRALTSQEVLQNYNATKSRFGL